MASPNRVGIEMVNAPNLAINIAYSIAGRAQVASNSTNHLKSTQVLSNNKINDRVEFKIWGKGGFTV